MRKVSSYIRLPVISAEQNSILGTITGVLCDKRLKNVHYFILEDVSSPLSERRYVAQRSLKIIADESVILSNVLCIKNDADVSPCDLVRLPLGEPVFSSDGRRKGVLEDVCFSDSSKKTECLVVNGGHILPERVADVSEQGVVLLPDGKKRLRRAAPPRTVNKPDEDFSVQLFDESQTKNGDASSFLPVRLLSNYRFLVGRVATANVYDENKKLIIKTGTLITAEIVINAHKANRLVALTLASRP